MGKVDNFKIKIVPFVIEVIALFIVSREHTFFIHMYMQTLTHLCCWDRTSKTDGELFFFLLRTQTAFQGVKKNFAQC